MAKGNNMLPNAHFHKHWQRRIKTWFDQPARKHRRRQARIAKAARVAPRPAHGALRPAVRCPSIRYNTKVRLGRGFTLEEIKVAGLTKWWAKSIGIAVDYRRKNRSPEELKLAAQLNGKILPIKAQKHREKAVPVPKSKFSVYKHLRRVRADTREQGKREKKAREAAEEGLGGSGRR